MAPPTVKSLLIAALSTLSLAAEVSPEIPEPRFVRLPISKAKRHHVATEKQMEFLTKRQTPFDENITNEIPQGHSTYLATVGVGTQPQNISLVLDTGSSDIWMFGQGACPARNDGCGGTYSMQASSSVTRLPKLNGLFQIQYGDGSKVTGDYFRDNLDVGGMSVQNLTMAVATQADISSDTGVMGIGYRLNEAIADEAQVTYPNIMDVMLSSNLVSSKTYSLYLDDVQSSTGQIIFGGYDSSRWQGDLQIVPVVPDENGRYSTFSVVWTSIGITTPQGESTVLSTSSLPLPALLDSGSSLAAVPQDVLASLISYFGAQSAGDGSYAVDCSIRNQEGTIDFGFSGDGGPIIAVPFSEVAIPIYAPGGGGQATNVCLFGFQASVQGVYVFGDTILRSAYIAYDLDNNVVGLSQAIFNDAAGGNLQEIPSGGVPAIPSATMAPNTDIPEFASSTPSASPGVDPGYIGGYGSSYGYGYGSSIFASPTASSQALQGQVTSYTNRYEPTGIAGGSSSGGGAAGGDFSSFGSGSGSGNGNSAAARLGVAGVSAVMMMIGAAVLLL